MSQILNIKGIGEFLSQLEPVNNFINGVLLISKAFSFFLFFPLKLLGYNLAPAIMNLLYLGVIFYVLYKLTGNSLKTSIIILVVMIIIGGLGGV